MSIDDEDKLRSVAGIKPIAGEPPDADDAQHVAGFYRGVPVGAGVGEVSYGQIIYPDVVSSFTRG
jgi:hypothetical protein